MINGLAGEGDIEDEPLDLDGVDGDGEYDYYDGVDGLAGEEMIPGIGEVYGEEEDSGEEMIPGIGDVEGGVGMGVNPDYNVMID